MAGCLEAKMNWEVKKRPVKPQLFLLVCDNRYLFLHMYAIIHPNFNLFSCPKVILSLEHCKGFLLWKDVWMYPQHNFSFLFFFGVCVFELELAGGMCFFSLFFFLHYQIHYSALSYIELHLSSISPVTVCIVPHYLLVFLIYHHMEILLSKALSNSLYE